MEVTGAVLKVLGNAYTIAKVIYDQCDQAKTNKKLCSCLKKRIKLVMMVVAKLEKQPKKAAELGEVLEHFRSNLQNAEAWVRTYSGQEWWKRFFLAISMYKKFLHINDQLGETAQAIQMLLQIEHREDFIRIFKKNCWKSLEEDITNLIHLTEGEMRTFGDKMDSLTEEMRNMKLLMLESFKPWDIKEIPAKDLKREGLLLTNDHHSLYIGEYHWSPVLIKDLKGQLSMDNGTVQQTFEKECKIKRKYESPNILKLFGICIDQSDVGPRYSLVTEYCEKGTLRDLLRREPNLIWERRVIMALDAARAVYWIHHTEKKAMLHGKLSSIKYLVTASYCLKLSGFEFSKTESSMRRNASTTSDRDPEWAYFAPEVLQNICNYDMRSEIYSLGIVIYETATGSLPLQGQTPSQGGPDIHLVYQMVNAEVSAGLSDTCPLVLRDIIQTCLKRNPWDRPTAGGIADRLVAYDRELRAPLMGHLAVDVADVLTSRRETLMSHYSC